MMYPFKLSDIKDGDRVYPTYDTDCLIKGVGYVVFVDDSGPYVNCGSGGHYLYDFGEEFVVGFEKTVEV